MNISVIKNTLYRNKVFVCCAFLWIILVTGTFISNIVPTAGRAERSLKYCSSTITSAVGPLHNDSVLIQNFTVKEKIRLSEIAFTIGTYGEAGYEKGILNIKILDSSENVMMSGAYETVEARDGFPWSVIFGQNIEFEQGEYSIEIAPSEFEKPIAFFTAEKESDFLGELLFDGQSQEFPLYISAYGTENNSFLYGYFGFFVFSLILILGFGSWCIFKGAKIENAYAFLAITLGILFMFVYPVYSYNDETSHVSAVLRYLGDIWPVDPTVQQISNEAFVLRDCELYENTGFTLYRPTINQYRYIYMHFFEMDPSPNYIVSSADAVGTFYEYIPQILGIALARVFHLGSVTTLFLAQLLALFFSVFVFRLAIKITPFKEMFAAIALVPVIVKVNGSFSYDLFLNAVIILMLAIICDRIWGNGPLSNKAMIGLIALAILALPPKIVYFPIIALIIFISRERVKCTLRPVWICCVIACGIVLMVGLQSADVITGALDTEVTEALGPWGNPVYTYSSFLEEPLEFIRLYFNSLVDEFPLMLWYAVGLYQHINLPIIVAVAVYVTMLGASWNSCQYTITKRQKTIIALIIVSVVLMLYFVALSWTTIGNYSIMGMQGRYLQPLFPLFLILLMPQKHSEHIRTMAINWRYTLFIMMNINLFSLLYIFREVIR